VEFVPLFVQSVLVELMKEPHGSLLHLHPGASPPRIYRFGESLMELAM